MQRLEVSGAVRPIYGSLGVKRLRDTGLEKKPYSDTCNCEDWRNEHHKRNIQADTFLFCKRASKLLVQCDF